MPDNLMRDMNLFVEVAMHKNFSYAAEILGIPVSTLSRRIARMEKHLEIRLFNRNSRTVSLTEAGTKFYERCKFIVFEAKLAHEELLSSEKNPSGTIRISVPAGFYKLLSGELINFSKKFPYIRIHLHEKEEWSNLLHDRFDLEIRIGHLPDSNLIARQLTKLSLAIYASPKLFETTSIPMHPQDLLHLPCICLKQTPLWRLVKGDVTEDVYPRPTYQFNNGVALHDFALAGMGFAPLPLDIAEPYVKSGKLVRILEDWHFPENPVYLVMPSKQLPLRVSLFVKHLLSSKLSCFKSILHFSERLDCKRELE